MALARSQLKSHEKARSSFVLLPVVYGHVLAQSVPAFINYQGQLTDANGTNLATSDYALTFRIYDAATGGNLIWGPQVFDGATGTTGHGPRIPVVQGYFNVLLGQVDTGSRPLSDAFNGANRYVEVQVGGNSPITPRQQILTAPFAFRANGAENLTVPGNGSAVAVAVSSSGNVGIGTTTPDAVADVKGGGEGSTLDVVKVTGSSGSPVFRVFRDSPKNDTTLAFTVARNGKVGIGKPDPQVALVC